MVTTKKADDLLDILHSDVRFILIILGSSFRSILAQTRILLWFPRSRDP